MSLAPWRSILSGALHRNRSLPYARYAQLATVRPDGKPANRTIVFRGFLEDTNQLKFVTDDRSEKPKQIEHCPWAELCWYFPNTREQFRFAGKLSLIDHTNPDEKLQKARQLIWQELSDSAQLQFAWEHPGQPRAASETFSPPAPGQTDPLPQFCLLLLDPTDVDHLELRGDPQNRHQYHLNENGWTVEEVNP
ncbi:Npun_F5749 family FMN-dependent PPOX-type flavoprotein [Leptolyngbya sp. NIES-2104]|uniref:Npun_F5749 family FMN-dependent PPOX-type flavoprotein n=1 Tax=Leptolyngbya sp. NIES-2104 TaxID=1552121 RepID=UPI0006EC5A1D|nr:Npun_F5749 family FMN-dependent PPOX-type flavoprotein [Leptolyngbya sp. NIES-2104]GAP97117.1 pyridoxamine 5'-phosphate oxidase [Leptolyngbya sp. NIES-2104]